jgi:hypothetical protein
MSVIRKVLQQFCDRLESSLKGQLERMVVDGELAGVHFRSSSAGGLNGTDFSMRYCWLIKVVEWHITEAVGVLRSEDMQFVRLI